MSELPAGWVVTPLGELLHAIEAGQNVKCEERAPQGNEAGLVKISAVTWGRFDEEASKTLPQEAPVNERNRIRPGDLLISRANTIELVGASVIVGPIERRLYLSDKVLRLVVDEPAKRWINYALKTPQLRQAIQAASTGNQLSMRNIPQEKLRLLNIPLAPAIEQTRIADQLDILLSRIQACNERLDAIPALLKRFREAVLSAATSGSLTADFRGHTSCKWVDAVPEGWRLVKFSDACTQITVGYVGKMADQYRATGVPFLRSMNVRAFKFDPKGLLYVSDGFLRQISKSTLRPGDLAIVRSGAPGVCCVVPPELREANCSDLVIARPSPELISDYGCIVMNSSFAADFVRSNQVGVAQAHFNVGSMKIAPLPLPPVNEQVEIVRRVKALFKLDDRIEARHAAAIAHIRRLTPLTLAKAFRGELVRQDPNDEPASVLLQRLAKTPTAAVKAPRGRPRIKQANPSTPLPTAHPDWTSLPAGAWAAGAQIDEHATAALLIAVLKAWGQPMPQDQARLAAMLCLQPRLFTAALPAHDAAPWRRLVGAEAEPLPASVAALQPAVNTHWRRALAGLRARGDLVASGSGPQDTWSLGRGADRVDTTGWPDGRAGWVVAYLRAHGVEAVLPMLPTEAVDFVHAHAA